MNSTIVRTLSGIVFLGIMVSAILLNRCTFTLLISLIVALGLLEFYRMTVPKAGRLQVTLGIIGGVSLILLLAVYVGRDTLCFSIASACLYDALPAIFAVILFLSLMGVFIAGLYHKAEKPFEHISYLLAGILYIALPFSLMSLLTFWEFRAEYSGILILAYFILLWSNDVGAYCFGITLGRGGKHKLFPRHSPKKTWEGFIGGMLMAMLAGFLISHFLLNTPDQTIHWIAIGLIVSIFGTLGDLTESMLKRSFGVKDSGNIMPGHGGILDRFDGVLLSFIPVLIYFEFVIL